MIDIEYYKFKILILNKDICLKGGSFVLNRNEQKVFELLNENPYLSQQAIADRLDMNRSTVATIISSLTDKRKILGKAYILNHDSEVVCIGGINIDRKYTLEEAFVPKTSNPVISSISVGGVARNIAENLGRLNVNVSLLSVAGQDQDYDFIKQETETYVDLNQVTIYPNESTSSYSAILDNDGEMQFALADMSISDHMDYEWIQEHRQLLIQSKLIVLDLNVSKEVVQEVINIALKNNIELVIIPVSGPKMKRLPNDLEGVGWLIVNLDESETYHQISVESDKDVELLADKWLETGIEQVLITRGKKSSVYAHQDGTRYEVTPPLNEQVVDVTGAGDSNASGIIYGITKQFEAKESIQLGMTNAYHTVQSNHTVRHNLNEKQFLLENESLHKV